MLGWQQSQWWKAKKDSAGYLSLLAVSQKMLKIAGADHQRGWEKKQGKQGRKPMKQGKNPWKLHESLVRVWALTTAVFSIHSIGRKNLFCDWHNKSPSVDVPGTPGCGTRGPKLSWWHGCWEQPGWPWHTNCIYLQCLLLQTPLASFSLPSVPVCGVASCTQILLIFHLSPRYCLSTMQLPGLRTAAGQNYTEQTITVWEGINRVPVAGNNYKNTDAIKMLAFKDNGLD